jgi:phenylacetate-CoA ligase
MAPFAGRGDNMIKLRGVNVWPEALGRIAAEQPGLSPDYFVRAVREGNRDELVLHATSERPQAEFAALGASLEAVLREKLGVKIAVKVERPGALDEWTGLNRSPKLKRFRDERKS